MTTEQEVLGKFGNSHELDDIAEEADEDEEGD
jgi:hypothetical protein